jgi:hypothetical protein
VKAIFGLLLLISILFPVYAVLAGLQIMLHNQYEGRFRRLHSTEESLMPSGHLGLTKTELAVLDRDVVFAYTDAVGDGFRLGRGYSELWLEAIAVDGLLFVSSVLGLWACRLRRQSPNHAMERTADRPGSTT